MKRLKRNPREGMLLGVCAGIADYFDIDPTVVRVGMVIAGSIWGLGFVGYVIAALIIPED